MRKSVTAAVALIAVLAPAVPAASAASAAARPGSGGRACAAPPLPPAGAPLVVDPGSVRAPSGTPRPVTGRAERRRVLAAVANFVTCVNAGDHLRAAPLLSAHFVRDFMHQDDYREVPAVLGGLRIERVRVGEVLRYPDGSFTTELRYLGYRHQLSRVRMTWWPDRSDGFLKLNRLTALPSPVPARAAEVRVEMGEYFFRLDRAVVRAPHGRVVLRLRNVGRMPHEAILLRLPAGATGADLFNGRLPQRDVTTIAQENGGAELSLTGLAPGDYTLVDFIPAADGVPNGAHGMTARFTVVR
ncbi:hypothetical protein ACSNOI_08875 [Actinomadura kijaniata]|uniref:hypothetical protein n=1 Tax=Actinomadura kijaniata TaxID=46161 RepID=UPI003F1948DB